DSWPRLVWYNRAHFGGSTMLPFLQQVLKRCLIVAGTLGAFGFVVSYLLNSALPREGAHVDLSAGPLNAALLFAASGLIVLLGLEALAAGLRVLRGQPLIPPPPQQPTIGDEVLNP